MPPVRNARRTSLPNSEFRTCPDPELQNAIHSEFMNTPNVEFLNVPLCKVKPMSYLASSKWGRSLCYRHVAAHWCLQRGWGCGIRTCVMAIGETSKCISSFSFVRIKSNFFYNTQETQMQKMMDQNFEIRIL